MTVITLSFFIYFLDYLPNKDTLTAYLIILLIYLLTIGIANLFVIFPILVNDRLDKSTLIVWVEDIL